MEGGAGLLLVLAPGHRPVPQDTVFASVKFGEVPASREFGLCGAQLHLHLKEELL